jgi:multisubunit Na+/H+ antiporter MnhF subunit
MDPFARKMVYGSFVYGGMLLVMFAVLTVVYLHTRPRCSDRVVAESTDQSG